jgi:glycosyltransferase involved in cell wall biosynthesis
MQLNVLILAYHFSPSNSSAAHRPESWARHGKKFGLNPTIVTRHWTGLENDWLNFSIDSEAAVVIEKTSQAEIIRLPYKNLDSSKGRFWRKWSLSRKLYYLCQALSGNFHTQANVMSTFKPFLTELLQQRRFDYIIATAPPYQLVELAYELSCQFNIPFITDIRDLWNDNKALQVNAKWSIKERFNEKLSRHYVKKWVKRSSLVTAVAAPLGEVVTTGIKTPFAVVTNGYESNIFDAAEQKPTSEFTVTLTGTVYPEQKFDILLEGFRRFLAQQPKAKLHFIGVSIIPGIEQKIRSILPGEYIVVKARVPKKEAIDLTVSSHVLFYVGWQGYRGFYTGKIFEYLAAKKNILIAPGDNDVIDELLVESNAGISVDTPDEVEITLNAWYKEWVETGMVSYGGREEIIKKYSREEQTRRLAEEIYKISSGKGREADL